MELENRNLVGSTQDEKDDHIFECHDKIRSLKKDIFILIGRLKCEDFYTFAPEAAEVVERWEPEWAKMTYNHAMHPDGLKRCQKCHGTGK